MKGFTEHLSTVTKAVVVDEESQFSTLNADTKPFLQSALYQNYLPSDLLQRIEAVKSDFNSQVKKLIEHFVKARGEAEVHTERKIELLKADVVKGKNELA